jgi:hypothetical protein
MRNTLKRAKAKANAGNHHRGVLARTTALI